MTYPARARREADLASYYDHEVAHRLAREVPAPRVARRLAFVELLRREDRFSVLEVGAGPGRDGTAFREAGLRYSGVDLAPESAAVCRAQGLDVQVASVLRLPFEDRSFDAGWTMSTLLHVADADVDAALTEIVRVLRPGAPLAIGLWGDANHREGPWGTAEFGPQRFFSLRTDEAMQTLLSTYGTVEEWATWDAEEPVHYQWTVVRTKV